MSILSLYPTYKVIIVYFGYFYEDVYVYSYVKEMSNFEPYPCVFAKEVKKSTNPQSPLSGRTHESIKIQQGISTLFSMKHKKDREDIHEILNLANQDGSRLSNDPRRIQQWWNRIIVTTFQKLMANLYYGIFRTTNGCQSELESVLSPWTIVRYITETSHSRVLFRWRWVIIIAYF